MCVYRFTDIVSLLFFFLPSGYMCVYDFTKCCRIFIQMQNAGQCAEEDFFFFQTSMSFLLLQEYMANLIQKQSQDVQLE